MNKDQFLAAVAAHATEKSGKRITAGVVDAVLAASGDLAAREVVSSGHVRVPGLVNLTVKRRAARIASNPKTGAPCEVAAGITVKAKPVASLASAVREIEQQD